MNISMVDLKGQYLKIKEEVDSQIQEVISSSQFIGGDKVNQFSQNLATFHNANYAITCANGTDALQIALMSLNLNRGDEVILPAFTYIATVEVIALLGLKPILVDVEWNSFNIDAKKIESAITDRTRVIVPVHLFGLGANMQAIMDIAKRYNLFVIEDNAQAIGTEINVDGAIKKSATIGNIGCTSFFPSKTLGCYGDGGAIITDDKDLANRLHCIANHGQKVKYHHSIVGCNSRLDAIQAAILNVKLKYLKSYILARQSAAKYYLENLSGVEGVELPSKVEYSTHTYHQFTIKTECRDDLKGYLQEHGIPSMIYYPLPIHYQEAYKEMVREAGDLSNSTKLSKMVLSLPMHTELNEEQLSYICNTVKSFFKR